MLGGVGFVSDGWLFLAGRSGCMGLEGEGCNRHQRGRDLSFDLLHAEHSVDVTVESKVHKSACLLYAFPARFLGIRLKLQLEMNI